MSLINNSKITNYINDVCSYIKYKESHYEIKEELISHIEDIYDEYIEQGESTNTALNKAITRMGNSQEVGTNLNIAHKGSPDWITLILTLILVNTGVIFMYFMKSNNLLENSNILFHNTLKTSVIGTLLIIFLFYFDYRNLKKYSTHIFIVSTIVIILFSYMLNEIAPNSIVLVGDTFRQIIFITPYLFIISLCGIFDKIDFKNKYEVIRLLLICPIPLFLFIKSGCITPLLIYALGFIVILSSYKIKKRFIIAPIVFIASLTLGLIIIQPYRFHKLKAFMYFKNDPTGFGYQNNIMNNILNSITPLGHGFSKNDLLLCNGHKELILNCIIHSLGWIGLIIIISLVTSLIIRLIIIKKYINDSYGRLLICSISSIFIFKIIFNILMNLNLLPILGVSMPFISYGVPENLFNMLSIGLVLSVYRRRSLSLPLQNSK
ncbi:FtsW/RodA/SpoVE family cell cycle protein [Clostridium botulinum]|uniref:FtsW/RodA/SpoVE family cell cycle protein n=1 Tax=Clostridium botulinum TaxID=1491 RepID=UPI0004D5BCAD|nr:FtsW/RodA/SpoVE family cell cycle protein [Clostridium botulinum]KEI06150.1 membrane protein [Clostridium botulinum C/D str. BKT75002]KEI08084.1 membrane protein [Clostridium botulinum C/D str. BKT2873]QPW60360.1 FtsW/RodA/SpoVE family cell cycle protein [Clostridium botulinum]